MAIPFRYRWSKRTLWRDLPLAGFVVGGLTALGVHGLPLVSVPIGSTVERAFCQEAPGSSGLALVPDDCAPSPVALGWARSAIAPTPVLTPGLNFLDHLAALDGRPRYPVATPPPFLQSRTTTQSPKLEKIVEGAVALIADQGLPTDSVSISLVDLTGDCCDYAAYQDQRPRYPASIVKLFWLVMLYGQYATGTLEPDVDVYRDDETLMAHYSNNGASSRIVDALTQTTSGDTLSPADYQTWVAARTTLNDYFLRADYPDLNIAHKTFPIPDLDMESRTGRDLQFASDESEKAVQARSRNYLTTAAVARLLYEIDTGQAISPAASDRIKQHLHHSPDPAAWQWQTDNAIAGFFGEYLPPDAGLFTKLGFTFDDGRQEAAIITSPDQQVRFALVVFANDAVFSENETIMPAIARYIYDQMHQPPAPADADMPERF